MSGVEITALVDTGAACSLLNEHMFDDICKRTKRPRLIQPKALVCGLGGKTLEVLGETEIAIDGAGPVKVLVTRGLAHQLIIGCDAIIQGHGHMNFVTNALKWYGQDFGLQAYPDHQPYASVAMHVATGHPALDSVLKEYEDVFQSDKGNLGHCDLMPFKINTGDAHPIRQRPYRVPLHKREIIEAQVKDMLEEGVIRPSQSPWASPITLVPKKGGELRFCVDYRRLNAVTIKDAYPLPLIQEIFDQLQGATIFSTLDLKSGYWQIPVAEEDCGKTAFSCHKGLYEFLRMPFGAANAPAVFQRTMEHVLRDIVGVFVLIYIDDIVVFSRNPEDHADHLRQVLERLRRAGLRTKPSKCHIGQEEVRLLGYVINADGIKSDPEKTRAIANMRPPQDVKEVRSFLGTTGYYRQTIAKVAAPLTAVTKKHTKWTEDCQAAFETLQKTLQKMLQSDQVLAYPRTDRPYKLYTDACNYAVGGVLVQTDDEGLERVVQYVSHQLNDTQRKWATIEKEAYAIIYCLNKLRTYLWGATFEILTDHKPLRCLFQGEVANTKIQRWAVLIAEFGAPINYRQGKLNVRADMLSRIRPMEVDAIDTTGWTEPQSGEVEWTLPLQFDGIDTELLTQRQKELFPDEINRATDEEDEDYELHDGILYSCRRPGPRQPQYPRILLPVQWRDDVIDRRHLQTGHGGIWKTMRSVQEAYVWPGMRAAVHSRLKQCAACQIHKPIPQRTAHQRMIDPKYPHQVVGMDLTGPFCRTEKGHVYMFTLICHLTGWADAYPISNKRGETIADILHREYFPRYGAPEVLISDRGCEFVNSSVDALCKACDVERRTTTPYHPQTNGKIERFHRTLKGIIERLMTTTRANWESQLGPALSAYRNTVSETTGYTPFEALYGRKVRMPLTIAKRNSPEGEFLQDDRIAALTQVWRGARDGLRRERERNEAQQRKKTLAKPLRVGDSVIMLLPGLTPTFQPRWDARWEVIRARDPVYWIRHLPTGREKVM